MTTSCARPEPINDVLLVPCEDFVYAEDVGWMLAHELNTLYASHCRLRYEALVEVVKARQED